LSHALELDAKVPEVWFQRALAYSRQGETKRALSDAREAIELDPKAEALHAFVANLEQQGPSSE
jgi:Tfp pilus assembly protein PilF